MTQEQEQKLNDIVSQLKELYPSTTTSIRLVITADESSITATYRHPEQLKSANISMRNIKGEWISKLTPSPNDAVK